MPFDFNQFVNTSQFSDPANYAGLNGQMPSLEEAAQKAALASMTGGIKPPSGDASIGDALMDFGQQAIKPIQQTYENQVNKVNKVATTVGNTFNSSAQQTKPWDMSTHFGSD